MLYTWKIKIYLKNGETIFGLYRSNDQNSSEVANKLLSGNDFTFNAILNQDGAGQLCFRLRDVSAMEISPA